MFSFKYEGTKIPEHLTEYEQDLRNTPLSPPVNGGKLGEERYVSSPRLRQGC
jgi:hypothetical protein